MTISPTSHPPRRRPRRLLGIGLTLLAASLLGACGGGGGGSGGGSGGQVAPTAIAYAPGAMPLRTDVSQAFAPTVAGGTPDQWSVSPALPPGLSLNAISGEISGTPTAPVPSGTWTVVGSNGMGSAQTDVTLEVIWHQSKNLQAQATLSEDDLRHFMERTHFGFIQTHWDVLNDIGLAAYVDAMTTYADTTQLEADGMTFFIPDPNFPSEPGLARWWLYLAELNLNPFQEAMALMWHDHFATSTSVLGNAQRHYFIDHINLWRHDGAGNLRQLLIDMCRDAAMLEWLDGVRNNGAPGNEPNENFAREFFELFCLGVDVVYTEEDIVQAARAFTGWRSRFDPVAGQNFVEFDPNRHDAGDKTVLGTLIPGQNATDDFEAMVDLTLAARAPGTTISASARWIARRIVEHFCYRDAPENVIDELAQALESGGWEIKPILMTLFQSEAFYSARAKEGIIKSPVEHMLGFTRATGLIGNPVNLDQALTIMGNRPSQPPVVDGWPADTSWFSAQAMIERTNLLHYLTVTAKPLHDALNINVLDILPAPDANSTAVVDAMELRLRCPLTEEDKVDLRTYLDTEPGPGGTSTPSPFDQATDEMKDERLRGLLWILGQHPGSQDR